MSPTSDPGTRVVAITGAASGMGAACARTFARDGYAVEIIDMNRSGALAVAAEIEAGEPWIGSVADSDFCTGSIAGIVERHGRLDVLVNAAGTIHRADATATGDDDWARVMGVNVDGVFYMSRAAVEAMRRQGRGVIVNFGSIWGDVGSAGVVAYCASKGAIHQLTRAMALDHVGDGIRINAVAPGEVRTPMLSSHRETPPTEADLQRLADETIPLKRLAEPEEISEVVRFIADDRAGYMTGSIVTVDGGYTAR